MSTALDLYRWLLARMMVYLASLANNPRTAVTCRYSRCRDRVGFVCSADAWHTAELAHGPPGAPRDRE